MTIYRDSNSDYIFQHPHPGPLNVTIFCNGEELRKILNVNSLAGRFVIKLTYMETQYDGQLEFFWQGANNFSRRSAATVITPLLTLNEVKPLFKEIKGDSELQDLENSIRMTIESFTGQSFGLHKGTKLGQAVTPNFLKLPSKLVSLNSATPGLWVNDCYLTESGLGLRLPTVSYIDIKQAPPEEYLTSTVVGGVIRVPNYIYSFKPDRYYPIVGEWGYTHIPEDVKEASKMLINDYACGESIYRERYLESVKSEQSLTFNEMAFMGTGNVRVDQILEKYRKLTIGVV